MEAVIPLAIAQAGIAGYGAVQQNQATKRSARAAREGAAVQSEQLSDAADLERRKRETEAHLVRSRLRVIAAEAGLGFEGSFADLERQADIDEQTNLAIIDQNLYNQRRRVASGLEADLSTLSGRLTNPLLSAFQGGLSGATTGLQIASAFPGGFGGGTPGAYDIQGSYTGSSGGSNRPR